jgi:outer membrane protein assembly factor BamB
MKHMFIGNTSVILFAVLISIGCTKSNNDDSQPGVNIDGKLYYFDDKQLFAYDLKTEIETISSKAKYGMSDIYDFTNAFDSGVAYSADVYGISAIDMATGNVKWNTDLSSINYGDNNIVPRLTVSVKDSLVYVMAFTGHWGEKTLHAISKKTGIVKWKKITTPEVSANSWPTPVVSGDKIIVSGYSSPSKIINELKCYNRFTGAILWDTSYTDVSINPNLIARGNLLYIRNGSQDKIMAVDVNSGNTVWTTALDNLAGGKMFTGANDLIVYSEQIGGPFRFYYLDYNTGQLKNSKPNDGVWSWAATDVNYVVSEGRYWTAFDKTTHAQLWRTEKEMALIADTTTKAWEETAMVYYKDYIVQFLRIKPMLPPFQPYWQIGKIYVINKNTGVVEQKIQMDTEWQKGFPASNFAILSGGKFYRPHDVGRWNE